jgi:predicted ArsR family transcriptional regulator
MEFTMTKRKASDGAAKAAPKKAAKPKTSKLARLEAMLRQPAGATIGQLGKSLGWQSHSVRGAIAGSLKKKGIAVTSDKPEGGDRIYRAV